MIESIEKKMHQSWTMEKFIEQRKEKRIQLQKDAQERLAQFVNATTKEDGNEMEGDGDDDKRE